MLNFILSVIVWSSAFNDVIACGVKYEYVDQPGHPMMISVLLIGNDEQLKCAEKAIRQENNFH